MSSKWHNMRKVPSKVPDVTEQMSSHLTLFPSGNLSLDTDSALNSSCMMLPNLLNLSASQFPHL